MAKGLHTELNVITSDIRELYCQPSADNEDQSILITAEDQKLSVFFSNSVGPRFDTQELIFTPDYIIVKKDSFDEEEKTNSETHRFQLVNGNEICRYKSVVNEKYAVVNNTDEEKPLLTAFAIDGLSITMDIDQDQLKQFKFSELKASERNVFSEDQEIFLQSLFAQSQISISEAVNLFDKHNPQTILPVIYPNYL